MDTLVVIKLVKTYLQMWYIGLKSPTDPITFDPNFEQDIQGRALWMITHLSMATNWQAVCP